VVFVAVGVAEAEVGVDVVGVDLVVVAVGADWAVPLLFEERRVNREMIAMVMVLKGRVRTGLPLLRWGVRVMWAE
jgi:hypothetical protein